MTRMPRLDRGWKIGPNPYSHIGYVETLYLHTYTVEVLNPAITEGNGNAWARSRRWMLPMRHPFWRPAILIARKWISQRRCDHDWIVTAEWLFDVGRNKMFEFRCTRCGRERRNTVDGRFPRRWRRGDAL